MNVDTIMNLIVDMMVRGATREELERAIKHSTILIDAGKSYRENGIDELISKYSKKEVERCWRFTLMT